MLTSEPGSCTDRRHLAEVGARAARPMRGPLGTRTFRRGPREPCGRATPRMRAPSTRAPRSRGRQAPVPRVQGTGARSSAMRRRGARSATQRASGRRRSKIHRGLRGCPCTASSRADDRWRRWRCEAIDGCNYSLFTHSYEIFRVAEQSPLSTGAARATRGEGRLRHAATGGATSRATGHRRARVERAAAATRSRRGGASTRGRVGASGNARPPAARHQGLHAEWAHWRRSIVSVPSGTRSSNAPTSSPEFSMMPEKRTLVRLPNRSTTTDSRSWYVSAATQRSR